MTTFRYCLPLVFLSLASVPSPSLAQDGLVLEFDKLAAGIKAFVQNKGGTTVSVGKFSEPPDLLGSGASTLQDQFAEALARNGFQIVDAGAAFRCQNTFGGRVDKDGLLAVQVNVLLLDKSGGFLKVFQRDIFGPETVPSVLGIPAHTNPAHLPAQQLQDFTKKLNNPDVRLKGNQITTTADSHFAIEVLVKKASATGNVSTLGSTAYAARPPRIEQHKWKDVDQAGKQITLEKPIAYVDVKLGEVFAIRLINNHPTHEAAVNLSLDGVNCFRFSKVKSRYWLVPSKSEVLIKGWHKTNLISTEFKRTEFPESAAAKLKLAPSSNIGMITAVFLAVWPETGTPPADEATRAAGFGKDIQVKTEQVPRFVGGVRDTIVIRYERAN